LVAWQVPVAALDENLLPVTVGAHCIAKAVAGTASARARRISVRSLVFMVDGGRAAYSRVPQSDFGLFPIPGDQRITRVRSI
jgi:hypothetical protein